MTVMLITGAFDLSVASVAALAAAVLVGLAGQIGFVPAAFAALAVAATIGLINGAIVQFVGINAFIVTLGTLTAVRSEEHTSELQSLMRISYAVFCLKKKKHTP